MARRDIHLQHRRDIDLRGRPTKCTAEATAAVVRYLQLPVQVETAACLAGLRPETVYGWLRRGKAEIGRLAAANGGTRLRRKEAPYVEFSAAVGKQLAMTEAALVAKVADRKPEWFLAHRFPERWGPGATTNGLPEVTDTPDTTDMDQFSEESDAALAQLIVEQLCAGAGRSAADEDGETQMQDAPGLSRSSPASEQKPLSGLPSSPGMFQGA